MALILQGRIVTDWAELLEEECRDLRRAGLRVILDLSGVVFIGRAGVDALRRLVGDGIEIQGCSPLIVDLLEQEGIAITRSIEEMMDKVVPLNGRYGPA